MADTIWKRDPRETLHYSFSKISDRKVKREGQGQPNLGAFVANREDCLEWSSVNPKYDGQ
jgi:hypothetical protein